MRCFLTYFCLGAMITTVVAGRVYHVVYRPEWTEAQALVASWPVWLVAGLFALLGLFFAGKG